MQGALTNDPNAVDIVDIEVPFRKAGGYGLIQPNVEKMEGSHGDGA
ncbi:MAG: hypothetical protein QGI49_07580 [SAR202 cluster bacterium]|jgi:hypothetical protein|nr:hypothetical protein [SAR202 cluster bacterium]